MATKSGNLTPPICFSSTLLKPKSPFCIITTSTIKSFPQEIQQISRPSLVNPVVRADASGRNSPEPTSPTNTQNSLSSPTPPQDDLTYLLKLAAGSVLGAALIKYGTALLPDITKPNITLALLMISAPVVIAVLLLFIGSRKE